jgi:hypothetical protein
LGETQASGVEVKAAQEGESCAASVPIAEKWSHEAIVAFYRPNQEPVVLRDNDKLVIPELLPGWELAIAELWPPEFE